MKHQPPQVEDYESETPTPPTAEKRKRGAKSQTQTPDIDFQQPPSKTSKSTGNNEVEELDGVEEERVEEGDGIGEEDEEEYSEGEEDGAEQDEEEEEQDEEEEEGEEDVDEPKAHKVIEEFGRAPLDGTPIAEKPLKATPETVLAIAIDAMIKSRPISHDISQKTVNKILEVGYHDIEKLTESSWEERTMVLKDGGYNRYREQGATNLGNLADLVEGKYDGDLNNLLEKASGSRDKARDLIKEVKGLGDLAADLFFNSVQSVWPSMAPFVDARSIQTAEEIGIGTDLDSIYAELDQDPLEMSKFANGLSTVRLERKQGQLSE